MTTRGTPFRLDSWVLLDEVVEVGRIAGAKVEVLLAMQAKPPTTVAVDVSVTRIPRIEFEGK
jgi:hypothetical protein